MRNKKTQKYIVWSMIIIMLFSTVLFGISALF